MPGEDLKYAFLREYWIYFMRLLGEGIGLGFLLNCQKHTELYNEAFIVVLFIVVLEIITIGIKSKEKLKEIN